MQKKVSLVFDSVWILSKKDEAALPVEVFLQAAQSAFPMEVLDASLTECELVIRDETLSEQEIADRLLQLLKETFSLEAPEQIVEYTVTDYAPPQEDKGGEPAAAETDTGEPGAPTPESRVEEVMDRIHALIGAEEFKALAEECVRIAPGLKKYGTTDVFTHRCYIFAINEGNGLSTYLELFAELLSELGLFCFDAKSRVAEEKLSPPAGQGQWR